MYPVSVSEFEKLAQDHAISIISCTIEDSPGPEGVIRWTQLVLHLPGEGGKT